MSGLDRIRRSWDATSESYCPLGSTFLLCEESGEVAVSGACPEHGGDACLAVYGKVALLDAYRNPAIREAAEVVSDLIAEMAGIVEGEWGMGDWRDFEATSKLGTPQADKLVARALAFLGLTWDEFVASREAAS